MRRTERELEELGPPARAELSADLALMTAQLARLQSRLDYWRQRQLLLAGLIDSREGLRLTFGARTARISRREAQLLSFLAGHRETSFRAGVLAARAWGDPALSTAQVRNYVSRLRQKLDSIEAPCRIEASNGSGYRLTWIDPSQRER